MTKKELMNIIREEIANVLREELAKTRNAPIENTVTEKKTVSKPDVGSEPKKGPHKGKGTDSRGYYTSAGTVPGQNPGPNPPGKKITRPERLPIGKKLLNKYARGDVRGTGGKKGKKDLKAASFRASVQNKAREVYGTENPTKKQINSIIWSIATAITQRKKGLRK